MVDASHEEESCSTSQVSIAVNTNGFICGIIKEGISSIPLNKYSQMLTVSLFHDGPYGTYSFTIVSN